MCVAGRKSAVCKIDPSGGRIESTVTAMAKGQKRSNKEVKKPKQIKAAPVAEPISFAKGLTPTAAGGKKK